MEMCVQFRVCSKCKMKYPLTSDYFHSAGKTGFRYDCKACRNKVQKAYQDKNLEAQRQRNKILYYNDLEGSRKRHRDWAKNNPIKNRMKAHRRRSAKSFTILPKEIKHLYASPCAACGSRNSIEADHIVPIARGGRTSIGNLQPLCKSCNCSKGSKLMAEWKLNRSSDTIE